MFAEIAAARRGGKVMEQSRQARNHHVHQWHSINAGGVHPIKNARVIVFTKIDQSIARMIQLIGGKLIVHASKIPIRYLKWIFFLLKIFFRLIHNRCIFYICNSDLPPCMRLPGWPGWGDGPPGRAVPPARRLPCWPPPPPPLCCAAFIIFLYLLLLFWNQIFTCKKNRDNCQRFSRTKNKKLFCYSYAFV